LPIAITTSTIQKAIGDARPGGRRYDIVDARSRGLSLRVSPTGVQWSLRYQINGADRRLALGTVDQWSITEARELAAKAQAMLRDRIGLPDEAWLDRHRRATGKLTEATLQVVMPARPREVFAWTYAEGRAAYIVDRTRALREVTVEDYRRKLEAAELVGRFEKVPLPQITRQTVAEALAEIHRSGRETHAANVQRAVTAFWSWLERDENLARSMVMAGTMTGLRAPDRTVDEDDDYEGYVPPLAEVARTIAICRSGAVQPTLAASIELVCWTVQRRRTVAEARPHEFQPVGNCNEGLWIIPPKSLKKRLRNGRKRRPHVIPLPAPVWTKILAHLATLPRDAEWMFPQVRARRAGDELGHIDVNSISHTVQFMPGIAATPHDMRRAFATHGEVRLGLLRSDTQSILDHAGGTAAVTSAVAGQGDVTGVHYALHDGTHRSWPIMRSWVDAVEQLIAIESAKLPPVAVIRAAMATARRREDAGGLRVAAE
jgi:integrase